MLNRFMLLVLLFTVPSMEAARAESLPSSGSVKELDHELHNQLRKQVKDANDLTTFGGNWWNDSGLGPRVRNGGEWYFSEQMYGYPPRGAIMQTLSYTWNNRNFNGWDSRIIVAVYIVGGGSSWAFDITAQPSSTLDFSGWNIPANSTVYIAMYVDYLNVALYSPPYIDYVSSNVYYTY